MEAKFKLDVDQTFPFPWVSVEIKITSAYHGKIFIPDPLPDSHYLFPMEQNRQKTSGDNFIPDSMQLPH